MSFSDMFPIFSHISPIKMVDFFRKGRQEGPIYHVSKNAVF